MPQDNERDARLSSNGPGFVRQDRDRVCETIALSDGNLVWLATHPPAIRKAPVEVFWIVISFALFFSEEGL